MARIILSSSLVRFPVGGMSQWALTWLLGLREIGHETFFVEKAGWEHSCFDMGQSVMTNDCSYGVGVVNKLFGKYGLENSWCFVDYFDVYHGLSKAEVKSIFQTADLLIGMHEWGEWLEEAARIPLKVFYDGDPGWFQFRLATRPELRSKIASYDLHYTNAKNIGTDRFNYR